MKKLIYLVLILTSSLVFADTHLLNQIIDKAGKLYLRGNNIENQVLSEIFSEHSFSQRFPKSTPMLIEDMSEENIARQFHECVFLSDGSYDEHLTDAQAAQISGEMASFVLTINDLKLYRIEATNIFHEDGQTTSCALGVRTKDSRRFLLMQGFFSTP